MKGTLAQAMAQKAAEEDRNTVNRLAMKAADEINGYNTPAKVDYSTDRKTKGHINLKVPLSEDDRWRNVFKNNGLTISKGIVFCVTYVLRQIEEGKLTIGIDGVRDK